MPITSFASYGPTMQAFNANWMQANSELGLLTPPQPIILAGGYTQNQFQQDSAGVLSAIEEVRVFIDQARAAAIARENGKLALLTRAKQFRNSVLAQITDNTYTANLPVSPRPDVDLSKFAAPLQEMQRLWIRINDNATALGLSGPLTLQGSYDLLQFTTAIQQLPQLYTNADANEEAASFARTRRDNVMAAIYERMKQYRAAAPAMLPENSPALQNLPRLSPPPGTTPPALTVTGAWDAALTKARLTWLASTAPNLDKLQVRACTGGTYKAGDEEIVADLPANATAYDTDWGLTVPGAIASFKVYVMATKGNENGGKAVKVVRPTP